MIQAHGRIRQNMIILEFCFYTATFKIMDVLYYTYTAVVQPSVCPFHCLRNTS
jgi:hypothetical protein